MTLPSGLTLASEVRFTVALLPDFPPGGLVRLPDWLPNMKQLDFVKSYLLLGGLTIQADAYEPHLRLSMGQQPGRWQGARLDPEARRLCPARPAA